MELDDLLSHAYEQDQLRSDREGAVTALKAALSSDPEIMAAARAEFARLETVVEARQRSPGEHGCHISAVLWKLLGESLK